jgi:hypothetical protein
VGLSFTPDICTGRQVRKQEEREKFKKVVSVHDLRKWYRIPSVEATLRWWAVLYWTYLGVRGRLREGELSVRDISEG